MVADVPDISGDAALFESGRATLVLPEDAGPAPAGVPELRAGTNGLVDVRTIIAGLAGKLLVAEGGPSLAGLLLSLGLIDEFFVTIAPRVIAGDSGRVAHGPEPIPESGSCATGSSTTRASCSSATCAQPDSGAPAHRCGMLRGMFIPLIDAPGPPDETSLVIAVRGNRVTLLDAEPDTHPATTQIFLGMLSGRHCWAIDADPDGELDEFIDLRVLWGSVDEPTWVVAGRAVQLVEWRRTHRTADAAGRPPRRCRGSGPADARRAPCSRTRGWHRR